MGTEETMTKTIGANRVGTESRTTAMADERGGRTGEQTTTMARQAVILEVGTEQTTLRTSSHSAATLSTYSTLASAVNSTRPWGQTATKRDKSDTSASITSTLGMAAPYQTVPGAAIIPPSPPGLTVTGNVSPIGIKSSSARHMQAPGIFSEGRSNHFLPTCSTRAPSKARSHGPGSQSLPTWHSCSARLAQARLSQVRLTQARLAQARPAHHVRSLVSCAVSSRAQSHRGGSCPTKPPRQRPVSSHAQSRVRSLVCAVSCAQSRVRSLVCAVSCAQSRARSQLLSGALFFALRSCEYLFIGNKDRKTRTIERTKATSPDRQGNATYTRQFLGIKDPYVRHALRQ